MKSNRMLLQLVIERTVLVVMFSNLRSFETKDIKLKDPDVIDRLLRTIFIKVLARI